MTAVLGDFDKTRLNGAVGIEVWLERGKGRTREEVKLGTLNPFKLLQ